MRHGASFEQIFGRFKANQIVIATDGDADLRQLKAPVVGYLSKLLVQQATDTPVAFKVDVLNAIGNVNPGEIASPSSVFATGGAWQRLLLIMSCTTKTITTRKRGGGDFSTRFSHSSGQHYGK